MESALGHTKVMAALLEVVDEGLADADGAPLVLLLVRRHDVGWPAQERMVKKRAAVRRQAQAASRPWVTQRVGGESSEARHRRRPHLLGRRSFSWWGLFQRLPEASPAARPQAKSSAASNAPSLLRPLPGRPQYTQHSFPALTRRIAAPTSDKPEQGWGGWRR